eukprot:TRINITY_DN5572_c0_g1_i1.p1 TRINITY_DN5572_c0_g1~~TRINITY_DN5572_c0_g1_i1.p1  ORF type:complete len:71 (+),score=25.07 TRINITY_DN5572_c0_g1_i1:420-632(+)
MKEWSIAKLKPSCGRQTATAMGDISKREFRDLTKRFPNLLFPPIYKCLIVQKEKYRLRGRSSETAKAHRG